MIGFLRAFSIFIILFPSLSFAQFGNSKYGIEKFGNDLNMPFHSSFKIHQDPKGQIHFYSDHRFLKQMVYDGVNFITTEVIDNEKFSKQYFPQDNTNYQWLATDQAQLYIINNFDTLILHHNKFLDGQIENVYFKDEKYYSVTNDGFLTFTLENFGINILHAQKLNTDRILDFTKHGDTLFFKGANFYFLENTKRLEEYTPDPKLKNNDVFILPNNRIAIGDTVINFTSKFYQFLLSQEDQILQQHIDQENQLWLYLRQKDKIGLYIYDGELKPLEIEITPTNYITDIFEDDKGDIWIGTIGEGLIHLYDRAISVLNKKNGLASDNLWSSNIVGDSTVIINQGCGGLHKIDYDGHFKTIDNSSCQSVLLPLSKDSLLVSSYGLHLYVKNKLVKKYGKKAGMYSRTCNVIFEDSKQNIWLGTRKVLHQWTPSKIVQFIIPDIGELDQIIGINEFDNGHLILLIETGELFEFDGQNFKKLSTQIEKPNQLFKDLKGNLWITSASKGLYLLKDKVAKPIHGLPSYISYIQDTYNGYLWGICDKNRIFYTSLNSLLLSSKTVSVNFLTPDDGLPFISTNTQLQPAVTHTKDDQILFPNIHGAIWLDTRKILKQKKEFDIKLTFEEQDFSDKPVIQLPENDDFASFNLHGIYLHPEATMEHQYQLNDNAWKSVKDKSNFTINNIPNGSNDLKIRSKHINGTWQKAATFSILVNPPFYETWWFAVIVIVFLISSVFAFVKWRTYQLKQQRKRLQNTIEEQTKEIKAERQQLAIALENQKQLTQELNVIQRSKNRMYAQISHEFKSPLQLMRSMVKKTSFLNSNENQLIEKNIDHLLSISREILDLSKAESGKLKAKKDYYDIISIVEEQITMMQKLAADKSISIQLTSNVDRYFLEIDISLIQRVIQNLLSNAIKFSDPNDIVSVNINLFENQFKFEIEDKGIGIPEEEIKDLMTPYFQASNNMRQGTGIGLSLVKSILELHQSNLLIKSKINEGSTFAFSLLTPKLTQKEILENHLDINDIELQIRNIVDPQKPIILAVDDREEVLYFLKNSLQNQYSIILTKNGASAISTLDFIEPNLIITDYNMPIMNGKELLKYFRNHPTYKTIPIIILTGSSSEETTMNLLDNGADKILKKPIDEQKLVQYVNTVLHRNSQLLEASQEIISHSLIPKNIHNDDIELMQKLEQVLTTNLKNSKIKSEEIAEQMGLGEKTLRNKVKSITGLTIKEYLKRFRLEKAKYLLDNNLGNKSEVAEAVGFTSLSYFSRIYNAYYE